MEVPSKGDRESRREVVIPPPLSRCCLHSLGERRRGWTSWWMSTENYQKLTLHSNLNLVLMLILNLERRSQLGETRGDTDTDHPTSQLSIVGRPASSVWSPSHYPRHPRGFNIKCKNLYWCEMWVVASTLQPRETKASQIPQTLLISRGKARF